MQCWIPAGQGAESQRVDGIMAPPAAPGDFYQHWGTEGMELPGCGQRQRQDLGSVEGQDLDISLGKYGERAPSASSDLSHLLLLLHTLQFLSWLCNCVRGVSASLPSSNPICSFFAASLLPDNGHLAMDFSAIHLLGLFCPSTGKFAPVGLTVGSSAGFHTGFYCQQHPLSPPITPAHFFDSLLCWVHQQLLPCLNSPAGSPLCLQLFGGSGCG